MTQAIQLVRLISARPALHENRPADKRLAPVFPENRVVTATRFAIRFMPPLAILR